MRAEVNLIGMPKAVPLRPRAARPPFDRQVPQNGGPWTTRLTSGRQGGEEKTRSLGWGSPKASSLIFSSLLVGH